MAISVVEYLDSSNIVQFSLSPDKEVLMAFEARNMDFAENLNKSDAQQLVNELQALVDQMTDSAH